jgi:hypothetical protein
VRGENEIGCKSRVSDLSLSQQDWERVRGAAIALFSNRRDARVRDLQNGILVAEQSVHRGIAVEICWPRDLLP